MRCGKEYDECGDGCHCNDFGYRTVEGDGDLSGDRIYQRTCAGIREVSGLVAINPIRVIEVAAQQERITKKLAGMYSSISDTSSLNLRSSLLQQGLWCARGNEF